LRFAGTFLLGRALSARLSFATLVAFVVGAPLDAQQQAGATPIVNVRNAGAFICAEVLPALTAPGRELEKTAFLQWSAAYATAAARSNSLIDVFPLVDTQELVRMTSLVCYESLEVTYETALRTAIGRLHEYWVRDDPAIVTINDPAGRTIEVYAEAVGQIQRDLVRFGAQITVDGAYGNQTGNAVLALNRAQGLPAWMTPDGRLLYILTRPQG
jgi:hypothetical protein